MLSFDCELYSLSFHLWGNGGPNWRKEFRLFQEEERLSWRPAQKKAPKSFAEAVKSAPLSGANAEPIGKPKISNSLLNRLHFPQRSVFDRLDTFKAASSSTKRAHAAQAPRRADAVQASVVCPRCLMAGHPRAKCRRPIRCRACMGWGHTEANCKSSLQPAQEQQSEVFKDKMAVSHGLN